MFCSALYRMLGTCNHIVGLLFRVEAAVRCGLTNPSCTSTLCQWKLPKQKSTTLSKPTKIDDISWSKGHCMNQGIYIIVAPVNCG